MNYRERITRAYSWRYHPATWFLLGVATGIAIYLAVCIVVGEI